MCVDMLCYLGYAVLCYALQASWHDEQRPGSPAAEEVAPGGSSPQVLRSTPQGHPLPPGTHYLVEVNKV